MFRRCNPVALSFCRRLQQRSVATSSVTQTTNSSNFAFTAVCAAVSAAPLATNSLRFKTTMQVSDQDLALGNDMPPLLQYNEHLVNSSLALVEFANEHADKSTPQLEERIAAVMGMLFSEEFVPLGEQVSVVRALASMPQVRSNETLLKACHDITAALVPQPVQTFLVAVDQDVDSFDTEAVEEVDRFVLTAVAGRHDNDDEFVASLQSLQARVPQLDQNTHFIVLLQNLNDILLQARMAYLLTEACLSFDEKRTGKIKLAELEESLKRIMPKEAADMIMKGVEGDAEGNCTYGQMANLLLKGDTIKVQAQQQQE